MVDSQSGEAVFFRGHPSWRSLAAFYCKGLILSLLAGIVAGLASALAGGHVRSAWVVAAVLAAYLTLLGLGALRRAKTTYVITDRRLLIETGLLARHRQEAWLERVHNVHSRQTLGQRLLGIGTVGFETAADGEYRFAFRGVDQPRRVARTIDRLLDEVAQCDEVMPYYAPAEPRRGARAPARYRA